MRQDGRRNGIGSVSSAAPISYPLVGAALALLKN
jgi:hypothetical protein